MSDILYGGLLRSGLLLEESSVWDNGAVSQHRRHLWRLCNYIGLSSGMWRARCVVCGQREAIPDFALHTPAMVEVMKVKLRRRLRR